MFLTTVAAALLALHYNSQAVAILGMVGGYLTPALLAIGENRMWSLAGYTVILNLGALAIARIKRWLALEYLALAATWLLFLGWSSDWLSNETRAPAFVWLSVTFVLFFLAATATANLWLLALNTGVYFSISNFLLDPQYHRFLGAFAAALALLHGALAWTMREKDALLAEIATAIAVVLLTLAIPLQFVSFRITMLWSLEAAALAWLAARYDRQRFQVGAWLLFAAVFVRLFASDAQHAESTLLNARLLTFAISAASLWVAARFAGSQESKSVTYGAGHLVLLWALAMEVAGWAERTADPPDVANVSSTGISILMAVYALALIVAGVVVKGTARSAVNRILGLGLMALVIAKLYLIDVWQLSRGFRITAFLALGALLLLVSYLYSRFKPAIERLWSDQPVAEPPPL
jgi:uncharacterized membrane protein